MQRKALLVIAGLMLWSGSTSIHVVKSQAGTKAKPCPAQKINVADFGTDPRRVNFRLFLEKWLTKKKFTVTARPADADAILSGKLSIGSGEKYSYLAFKDAELKTVDGQVVWRGNFDITSKNAWGWLGRGHIENGAKRIAENVRADCR